MMTPWHERVTAALTNPPTVLYHATTPRKMARYEQTGAILPPVRGFDTLAAVEEWARLTNGRTIILRLEVEMADGSQGTAKIIGTKEACILIEEAFAEEKEGQ